jgi:transposase
VRQVKDLPVARVEVGDHVLHAVACGCGHVTRARVEGVTAPVQYGPRLVATAAYLQVAQMIPVARTVQTLADLCGVEVLGGVRRGYRGAGAVRGRGGEHRHRGEDR